MGRPAIDERFEHAMRQHYGTLADRVREHVEQVLLACNDNQSAAARVLGIDRKTLWRMQQRWARG